MINVNDLTVRFGPKILFANVGFQLNKGNHYGLVGANGSGKSTLLRILTGEAEAESGEVFLPNDLKLGVLKQDHFSYEPYRNLDVVLMGNPSLWKAFQEKEALLATGDHSAETGAKLGELEMIIADQDGYSAEAEAQELLSGLGITEDRHELPLKSLSGGYRLRVLLAQCLFGKPDFLLLDEPTNHLDLGSIQWLEDYLGRYEGTSLIISHDQYFLNRVSTHIMDIDYETIKIYPGDYDQFIQSKKLERDQKESEIKRQEKKVEEIQQFVTRFKAKATKARQANSKAKQLDRMEEVVIKRSSRIAPSFSFDMVRPTGKEVFRIQKLHKSYGDHQVLNNIDLTINRGDKIAIIGPNGIGKSTLLKIIAGELKPSSGKLDWGHEVYPGYFPQDHHDVIQDGQSAYEWLYSFEPSETIGAIRGLLGRVLIVGDEVHKKTESLSGGEAGRLIFARMMLKKPNLILVDEPTNHMDLETIEALGDAFVDYQGTIICVSHNRKFIETIANGILELKPNGFEFFRGSYLEYLEKQGRDYLDRSSSQESIAPKSKKKENKPTISSQEWRERQKEQGRLEKTIQKTEERIERLEVELEKASQRLSDAYLKDSIDQKKISEVEKSKQEIEQKLSKEHKEWESQQSRLDELIQEIGV